MHGRHSMTDAGTCRRMAVQPPRSAVAPTHSPGLHCDHPPRACSTIVGMRCTCTHRGTCASRATCCWRGQQGWCMQAARTTGWRPAGRQADRQTRKRGVTHPAAKARHPNTCLHVMPGQELHKWSLPRAPIGQIANGDHRARQAQRAQHALEGRPRGSGGGHGCGGGQACERGSSAVWSSAVRSCNGGRRRLLPLLLPCRCRCRRCRRRCPAGLLARSCFHTAADGCPPAGRRSCGCCSSWRTRSPSHAAPALPGTWMRRGRTCARGGGGGSRGGGGPASMSRGGKVVGGRVTGPARKGGRRRGRGARLGGAAHRCCFTARLLPSCLPACPRASRFTQHSASSQAHLSFVSSTACMACTLRRIWCTTRAQAPSGCSDMTAAAPLPAAPAARPVGASRPAC